MLLLLDRLVPAIARERLVVCYIRYKGQNSSDYVTEVCKLVRGTGYLYDPKTKTEVVPKKYPTEYFNRYSLDRGVCEYLINSIKDDDIYNQLTAYPNPEHRSVALAQQASIIFVLLSFTTKILENESTKMREIVDKHFPDNWVVPIYQGHLVDLTSYWTTESFEAASRALGNNIVSDQIKKLANKHYYIMKQSLARLDKFIIEGQLIEEYALDHTKELMVTLRDANTTLRWLMLHKSCQNKDFKQIFDDPVNKQAREKDIVKLILYLSKFEHIMKDIFTNLVNQKTQIWADDKAKCVENMNEIAEYFSGNRNWGKANIDENYAGWFRNLTTMIDGLDFKNSTKTGRKIQQIS